MSNLTLEAALGQLQQSGNRLLAGGTDLYPALQDAAPPARLLDVNTIDGLRGIEKRDGYWWVGAATTWTDIINADIPAAFECLQLAGREVGSVQIQNTGTLVGNLCNASPAADGVPALLALGASVEVASLHGTRILALDEFILGVRKTALLSGEMVTAIVIPDPATARASFSKLGSRAYLVISIAMLAVVIDCDEQGRISHAAIAVGACSPVALRLTSLEQSLIGQPANAVALVDCVMPSHLESLNPIADVRGTAEYRLTAVAVMIRRSIEDVLHKWNMDRG